MERSYFIHEKSIFLALSTFKKPFVAINKAKKGGLAKAVSGIVCYDITLNIYGMPFKDMTEIVFQNQPEKQFIYSR